MVKPEHRLNTFLTFRNTAPALPSTSPEPSDASPAVFVACVTVEEDVRLLLERFLLWLRVEREEATFDRLRNVPNAKLWKEVTSLDTEIHFRVTVVGGVATCVATVDGGSAQHDVCQHGGLLALQRRQALLDVWSVVEPCGHLLLVTDNLAANQPHASHALVEQLACQLHVAVHALPAAARQRGDWRRRRSERSHLKQLLS